MNRKLAAPNGCWAGNWAILMAVLMMPALLAGGCGKPSAQVSGPDQVIASDPSRNTQKAMDLSARSAALLEQDKAAEAEKMLKEAIAADSFFGPAHNNLGTAYFLQKKYYMAAWEYQAAAKLMPSRSEPRNNLAMVYETVGKLEDAMNAYEEAYELEKDNVEVAANLARIYVRLNCSDKQKQLRDLLTTIVLRDSRKKWVEWARQKIALMGTEEEATTQDSGQETGNQ